MVSRRNVRRRAERRRRPYSVELRVGHSNTSSLAEYIVRPRPDRRLLISEVGIVRTAGSGREIIGPVIYEFFFWPTISWTSWVVDDPPPRGITAANAGDDNVVGLIYSGPVISHDVLRWSGDDRPLGLRGQSLFGRWQTGEGANNQISAVALVIVHYEEVH